MHREPVNRKLNNFLIIVVFILALLAFIRTLRGEEGKIPQPIYPQEQILEENPIIEKHALLDEYKPKQNEELYEENTISDNNDCNNIGNGS